MRARYAKGVVYGILVVCAGLAGVDTAANAGSTVPDDDELPFCADVFVDGATLDEADYERGCIVTFEQFDCDRDGSVRYLSDLGAGGADQPFFLHADPDAVRGFCTAESEDHQLADFVLSMCLAGATPEEALDMAQDEGFTDNELGLIPDLVEFCPDN